MSLSNKIDDESFPMMKPFIFVDDVKQVIKNIKRRCASFQSAGAINTVIDEEIGDKLK